MAVTIETERKFLLKNLPDVKYDDIIDITQYYIKLNDTWERYRKSIHADGTIKYYKTIKTYISIGSSEEDEIELSKINYNKLIELCKYGRFESRVVNKKRHVYNLKSGLKWEIDKFKGMNVIIAEIEIPKMKSKFKTPDWLEDEIIMEITKYNNFSSKSLATIL